MKKEQEVNFIQEYGAGSEKRRRRGKVVIDKQTVAKKTPTGWQVTKTKTKTTPSGTTTKTTIKNKKNVKMVSKNKNQKFYEGPKSAQRY